MHELFIIQVWSYFLSIQIRSDLGYNCLLISLSKLFQNNMYNSNMKLFFVHSNRIRSRVQYIWHVTLNSNKWFQSFVFKSRFTKGLILCQKYSAKYKSYQTDFFLPLLTKALYEFGFFEGILRSGKTIRLITLII